MTTSHGTTPHTADLGLWARAEGLPELFAAMATALAGLMTKGPRQGEIAWLPLELEGLDLADLLVRLLNELVYRLDAEGLICVALELDHLGPERLTGRLGFIPRDRRHRPGEPVKAVTYHQARVEPQGRGWRAEVVLDV